MKGKEGTAQVWAETLEITSSETRVLAGYGTSNGWLDGQPAAVTRAVGKGSITYVGAFLDPASLRSFLAGFLSDSRVKPVLPHAPDGVEVCVRNGKQTVLILLNHNVTPITLAIPSSFHAKNLLDANTVSSQELVLPPHGVAVLQVQLLEEESASSR